MDRLILPDAGKTKQQFKSKTELFIGPRHHDMMGKIYDVRSAVEHLHENRYLEGFDRQTRLDLLQKEAVIDHVARTTLARIIGNSSLWPHFANTTSLAAFRHSQLRILAPQPVKALRDRLYLAASEYTRKPEKDGKVIRRQLTPSWLLTQFVTSPLCLRPLIVLSCTPQRRR